MTYEEASNLFATARSPERGKPLANNTRLYKRGDEFEIVLHQTAVVSILPEGRYILRTGGWNTLTTRDRINRYAPGRAFTKDGIMYWHGSGDALIFEEGMIVSEEGQVYEHDAARAEAHVREVTDMKKRIKRYVNGYMKALKGRLPAPSGGDCWYCCMKTEDGTPLGDETGDHSHLTEHMAERYYVPTLVVNALIETGYPSPALFLDYDGETIGVGRVDGGQIRRSLRDYLQRRLVPGAAGSDTVGAKYSRSEGFA